MRLTDFDFHLPEELIAQHPLPQRDGARMLVLNRSTQTWSDRHFRDFSNYIQPGDCLVVNDSRVFPSRLFGTLKTSGAKAEVFLLREIEPGTWVCLARPGRRLRPGVRVIFDAHLAAEVVGVGERGERTMRFHCDGDLSRQLERLGHVPLPPYIHRADVAADRERYQTVFARQSGSAAAPTAGLHFTQEILAQVQISGGLIVPVTLHVGLGTFQPIENPTVEENQLHAERYSVTPQSWNTIQNAPRVIAAGTTSVRTVETLSRTGVLDGETSIFLYPGQKFQRVNALLTNFHLPQSSLLLLVCAFGGTQLVMEAYRHAVSENYRFFSYGDCMLIV